MKVLMIVPYIYEPELLEFSVNKTGFGIMVTRILESIGEKENVELITRAITNGHCKVNEKYDILPHRWLDVITSINFDGIANAVNAFINNKNGFKTGLKKMYYNLDCGYIEKVIKYGKPDVIHLHGVSKITMRYLALCSKYDIPVVLTLHGLTSFEPIDISASPDDRAAEKECIIYCKQYDIPLTVVSTGMKNRIEQYLGQPSNNIVVVNNSVPAFSDFAIQQDDNKKCIRFEKSYYIQKLKDSVACETNIGYQLAYEYVLLCKEEGKKIIVIVGGITRLKNQIQIVKIASELCESENCIIALVGSIGTEGKSIWNEIRNQSLFDRVIMTGFCPEVELFWRIADLNILTSINEGFGMSFIEGYQYGVPSVTFSDLDAAIDVYSKNTMVLADDRSDASLEIAIKTALNRKWDRNAIKDFAKKFTAKKIASDYISVYERATEQ